MLFMDLMSLPSSLHSSDLFIPFVASSMFMWLLCTRGRLYWPILSPVFSVVHITSGSENMYALWRNRFLLVEKYQYASSFRLRLSHRACYIMVIPDIVFGKMDKVCG
jgi:hypothetical protein